MRGLRGRARDAAGGSLSLLGFRHAFAGLAYMLRTQASARVEAGAAVLAIALGWMLDLSAWEWIAILAHIALVLSLEAVNTSLEALCDEVTMEYRASIKAAKDAAAAAVLIAAGSALVTAAIVLLPKGIERFL